jgi:hypothetical protein
MLLPDSLLMAYHWSQIWNQILDGEAQS